MFKPFPMPRWRLEMLKHAASEKPQMVSHLMELGAPEARAIELAGDLAHQPGAVAGLPDLLLGGSGSAALSEDYMRYLADTKQMLGGADDYYARLYGYGGPEFLLDMLSDSSQVVGNSRVLRMPLKGIDKLDPERFPAADRAISLPPGIDVTPYDVSPDVSRIVTSGHRAAPSVGLADGAPPNADINLLNLLRKYLGINKADWTGEPIPGVPQDIAALHVNPSGPSISYHGPQGRGRFAIR